MKNIKILMILLINYVKLILMENMKDCKVIVCGPAIGKTYLAKQDDRFVDLDAEKAIYKYGLEGATEFELENGKFNRAKIVNFDSNDYIIKRLDEELSKGKIALISFHKKIIDYIHKNNVKYCLVYAGLELAKEYRERMRLRGNCDKFINELTNEEEWKKFYFEHKNNTKPTYKIELKSGEFLSDVVNKFF